MKVKFGVFCLSLALSALSLSSLAAEPAAKPAAAAPAAASAPSAAPASTAAAPAPAAAPSADPAVKKATASGICHDKTSPSYKQTKNFTPFNSMEECLKSGGKPLKK
jgi:hypothetical protein